MHILIQLEGIELTHQGQPNKCFLKKYSFLAVLYVSLFKLVKGQVQHSRPVFCLRFLRRNYKNKSGNSCIILHRNTELTNWPLIYPTFVRKYFHWSFGLKKSWRKIFVLFIPVAYLKININFPSIVSPIEVHWSFALI